MIIWNYYSFWRCAGSIQQEANAFNWTGQSALFIIWTKPLLSRVHNFWSYCFTKKEIRDLLQWCSLLEYHLFQERPIIIRVHCFINKNLNSLLEIEINSEISVDFAMCVLELFILLRRHVINKLNLHRSVSNKTNLHYS